MAVLGMASLLMAMLTPFVDLHAGALAGQKEVECKPGFVLDERTGQCVPEKPVEEPRCEPGTVLDERTGRCVPDKPVNDPPRCEPGTVLDERSGECVPEKPVDEPPPECPKDQTWNPDRGCVPVATEPPAREPEDPTVDVYIEKYDCAARPEVSLNLDDPRGLVEQCAANQVPIDMSHDVEGDGQDPSGQSGTSEFSWPDQPSGTHVIEEQVPEGYGTPVIYCTVVAPGEDGQVPVKVPVQKGNMVVLDVMSGGDVYCLWFNIQVPEESPPTNTGGTVDIYKSVCPAGVPPDMEVEAYQDECTLTGDWDFEVEWTDGTFTTDANGFVGWTDVPPGEWRITEALPEGYGAPVVWCRWLSWPPDVVDVDPSWFLLDAAEGIILIPLKYGDMHIECRWFNMREKGAFEPTPPPGDEKPTEASRGVELTVYKYLCPAGYSPGAPGSDPLHDCSMPMNGVVFAIERPDSMEVLTSTGDAVDGGIHLSGNPPGDYTITEEPPAGIESAFVWSCSNHGTTMPGATPLSVGYRYSLTPQPGDSITCLWFNIPFDNGVWDPDPNVATEPPSSDDTGIELQVFKLWCSDQATSTTGYQQLVEEFCEFSEAQTATVTVMSDGGSSTKAIVGQTPGTWNLTGDSWALSEAQVEGHGSPVAWCQLVGAGSGDGEPYRLENNGWSWMPEATSSGGDMACAIFNIPGEFEIPEPTEVPTEPLEPAELTIFKYECPVDYSLRNSGADPAVDCVMPVDGMSFSLESVDPAGYEAQSTTGDAIEGAVVFGGLAPGDYVVSEVPYAGIQTFFVWNCSNLGVPVPGDAPLAYWTSLSLTLQAGDSVTCYWFNIPAGDVFELDPNPQAPTEPPEPTAEPTPTPAEPTEEEVEDPEPLVTPWPEQVVDLRVSKMWCSDEASSQMDYQQLIEDFCEFSDKRTANVTVASDGGSSTKSIASRTPATWVVPRNTWTISEAPVDGYIDAVVWCQDVESTGKNGRSPGRNEPYQLKGRNWSWAARTGSTSGVIACAIFNIAEPTGQAPSGRALDLYHYSCPHSTVALSHSAPAPDAFLEACAPVSGWVFQLETDGGLIESITTDGGVLSWNGLPGGQWTVSQAVPPDHERPPAIWCQYLASSPGADLPTGWFPIRNELLISNEIMRLTVEHDGIHLECHWFNRLVEPHHLFLSVYECPRSAAGSSESVLLFHSGCRRAEAGIPITLAYGDGSADVTKLTHAQVLTEWWGIPDGAHSLVFPQYLAGIPMSQAYCGHLPLTYPDPVQFQKSQVPFTNGTLDITFDGQMEREGISCRLFAFTFGLAVSGPASGIEVNLPPSFWFMRQGPSQTRARARAMGQVRPGAPRPGGSVPEHRQSASQTSTIFPASLRCREKHLADG